MTRAARLLWMAGAALLFAPLPARAQDNAAPAIDPARLTAAQQVVAKMVPDGAYARMMAGVSGQMGNLIAAQMDAVPIGRMAQAFGLDAATAAKLDKVKISEINQIVDPHYRERTERMMKAMFAGMGEVMGKMEPDIREALAQAYARRFTTAQLADINGFFATPTGGLFATSNLEIASDPEYLKVMQKLMPTMMAQMPTLITKAQAATADLPPVRKYDDLTPAEKAKIKGLLGLSGQTSAR